MSKAQVSVLIPNYKTPQLTKICLRLLRQNTRSNQVDVIVIDNGSDDESLDYLRRLSWIRLIERSPCEGESVGMAHAGALDEGFAAVEAPYVLSIHTDTLVYHPDWLKFLLAQIEAGPGIAGVGSWKLEQKPLYRRLLKQVEVSVQSHLFPRLGKGYAQLEGKGDNFYYLRSHCALYRTDLIRKYGLGFSQGNDTAGRQMHKSLVENGHEMVFLPAEILCQYLLHVNHATMVLNPQLGSSRRSVQTGTRRIEKALDRVNARAILENDLLDR